MASGILNPIVFLLSSYYPLASFLLLKIMAPLHEHFLLLAVWFISWLPANSTEHIPLLNHAHNLFQPLSLIVLNSLSMLNCFMEDN